MRRGVFATWTANDENLYESSLSLATLMPGWLLARPARGRPEPVLYR